MCIIKPSVRKQLFVALCVYLGQMVLCFCRAWPGTGMFEEPEQTPLPYTITHAEKMIIDILLYVAIFIGCCIFAFVSNHAGRKPCFIISGFLTFCAFLLLATVKSVIILGIGKFLIGLGTGISYCAIIVYLGEIASTNIRGLLITSVNLFVFVQGWMDLLIAHVNIPYFVLAYFGSAVSAFFMFAVFYIPESPVFLTMKGTKENLENSLLLLGREDELQTMLSQKTELEALKKTHADHWLEIFKTKSNRKAVLITLTLNVLQSVSGYMGAMYFLVNFLVTAEHISFTILTIILKTSTTGGALCSLFLVEKVGRKTLLMISTGSCGISLGILSTYYLVDMWLEDHKAYIWIIYIILINYFFSYALGFNIIPETLVGELFTTNVRSTGTAFVISMSVITGYSAVLVSYAIIANVTFNLGLLFAVYCFTNIFAFIFTLFLVPETKGLTFTEINEMLSRKKLINLH